MGSVRIGRGGLALWFGVQGKGGGLDDVVGFEDGGGEAVAGDVQHGSAYLLGGDDVAGEESLEEGDEGAGDGVDDLVGLRLGLDSVEGLDESGAEHVGGFKGKGEEGVFGFALDAGPHDAAFFGAVGAGAGDVDEGHAGVESEEELGGGEGEVVGEVVVRLLGHAGGGDAEGEEAGVEAGEFGGERGEVEEVGGDEFAEFGMLLGGGGADEGEDLLDAGVEEAFAEDALTYHACRAEEKYVHGLRSFL